MYQPTPLIASPRSSFYRARQGTLSVAFAASLLALLSTATHAQTPSFAPITGLADGAVSVIAADSNAASPTLAVRVSGLGTYTGGVSCVASGGIWRKR